MKNERRNKRVPIVGSATLYLRDKDSIRPMKAMTVDISVSGIGVYSDGPIEKETSLSVDITFITSDGSLGTASVDGTVVFFRKIGNFYFVGIEFGEKLDPRGQSFLFAEIQKLLE
ncbi:MAG TPA: PilZ domain-containing protein [Thermodesulfovibrionales bacterium]|nr:PilZ domain-containing protein [Thermodesulfovibrionales bacterium]